MDSEAKDLISSLENVKKGMKNSLNEVPQEALNWNPLPGDANSIFAMVTHFCGSEGFWIRQVVGGTNIGRNRDSEFLAKGNSKEDLLALLDKTQESSAQAIDKASAEGLDRTVTSPNFGEMSARAAILHTIEHGFTHLGHVQLTKQWWEQKG